MRTKCKPMGPKIGRRSLRTTDQRTAHWATRSTTSWRRTPMTQRTAHDEMRAADAEITAAVGIKAILAPLETRGILREWPQ
jgi:hypothetical protein